MRAPALMPGSMHGAGARPREWAAGSQLREGGHGVESVRVTIRSRTCGLEGDTAWRGQELYSDGVGASDGLRTFICMCMLGGRRGGSLTALGRGRHGLHSE